MPRIENYPGRERTPLRHQARDSTRAIRYPRELKTMLRWIQQQARRQALGAVTMLLAMVMVGGLVHTAVALITGGKGNMPVSDPGWLRGSAAIFNNLARVAWWEGPPFGGGQWHAECRGNARALSAVLDDFVKLDVKAKQVVV